MAASDEVDNLASFLEQQVAQAPRNASASSSSSLLNKRKADKVTFAASGKSKTKQPAKKRSKKKASGGGGGDEESKSQMNEETTDKEREEDEEASKSQWNTINRIEFDRSRAAAENPQEQRRRYREILDNFTPTQLAQYDAFRQSRIEKNVMKKAVQQILDSKKTVNDKVAVVLCAIAKMFVGQVIEESVRVKAESGDVTDGPVRPAHMREAYRRLTRDEKIPLPKQTPLFKR